MNRINIILLSIAFLLLTGCYVNINVPENSLFSINRYVPNMQNVPLFKEKSEAKLNFTLTNLQAAYAITDNIGIIANGFLRYTGYKNNDFSYSSFEGEENKYNSTILNIELGPGYFNEIKDNIIFNVYAGAGYGKCDYFHHKFEYSTGEGMRADYNFSSNILKFFIQPGIGFSNGTTEFAFSAKIVNMYFQDVKNIYSTHACPENYKHNLDYITEGSEYYFIEPALTLKYGSEKFKFSSQIIYSAKINNKPMDYYPLKICLGFNLNFISVFRKKEQLLNEKK